MKSLEITSCSKCYHHEFDNQLCEHLWGEYVCWHENQRDGQNPKILKIDTFMDFDEECPLKDV